MLQLPYHIWSAIPRCQCSWVKTITHTETRVKIVVQYNGVKKPRKCWISFERDEEGGFWYVKEHEFKMPQSVARNFDIITREEPIFKERLLEQLQTDSLTETG
jgi:hypothetical protein